MSDVSKMADVTEGLPTAAAKIRALEGAGFSRSEIADFLGKRPVSTEVSVAAPADAINDDSAETIHVVLSPYAETPLFYRTTVKVEGAKRRFDKSMVSVVSRDKNSIVLSMPKAYADTRAGISTLILDRHVRNVVTTPAPARASSGRLAESAAEWDPGLPERLDVQVGPAGRIVIPAVFRNAMGVKEGDRLMARVVDGELRLISPPMAVKRAQRLVRELIPGDDSLADELVADRRREFERELSDG